MFCQRLACVLASVAAVALLVRCNQHPPTIEPPTEGSDSPPASYVPDPNVYAVPADQTRIVEETSTEGEVSRFPTNQLLLVLNEGLPRSVAETLASRVNGRIVGQVPDIAFYQIELDTSTVGQLDAAIALLEAEANVTAAGPNVSGRLLQTCPAEIDNEGLREDDRCAFTATEYYQAITMFEYFRPHVELHRVIVGIVDSGLEVFSGEFDTTHILNLGDPGREPTDSEGHGTAIAGVIAAANNGRGINGLASSFLHENLWLAISPQSMTPDEISGPMCIAAAASLADCGAQIINMSFGWRDRARGFRAIREGWFRIMRSRADVLFVAAAGNQRMNLTGSNYAPAGIILPNVITVGATLSCDPQQIYAESNFGSAVDVYAPGDYVPTTDLDGSMVQEEGTSLAAPQVAALAAVLKSIQPSLSANGLKRYLMECALLTDTPRARLMFTTAICQLLIDMGVPDPVHSWIDPLGLGHAGSSGVVLSRLCPTGFHFSVDGYGTFDSYTAAQSSVSGFLGGGTVSVMGAVQDEASLSIGNTSLPSFALGSYVVTKHPGSNGMAMSFRDAASLDPGVGVAGTVTFDSCRIEQRHPMNGVDPWLVRVSVTFEGVLQVAHLDGSGESYNQIDGYLSAPLIVGGGDNEQLFEYLETSCEGGLPASH